MLFTSLILLLARATFSCRIRGAKSLDGCEPAQDLLHVLLRTRPGVRIDVRGNVDSVGELVTQELPLQPGETTLERIINLRLRDGSVCEWRLWGKDAETHGEALLGKLVVVRGTRPAKLQGECKFSGCTRVDICYNSHE